MQTGPRVSRRVCCCLLPVAALHAFCISHSPLARSHSRVTHYVPIPAPTDDLQCQVPSEVRHQLWVDRRRGSNEQFVDRELAPALDIAEHDFERQWWQLVGIHIGRGEAIEVCLARSVCRRARVPASSRQVGHTELAGHFPPLEVRLRYEVVFTGCRVGHAGTFEQLLQNALGLSIHSDERSL